MVKKLTQVGSPGVAGVVRVYSTFYFLTYFLTKVILVSLTPNLTRTGSHVCRISFCGERFQYVFS